MTKDGVYETVPFRDARFPLKVMHTDYPAAVSGRGPLLHWHEHMELHWFEKGGARALVGSDSIETQDGDVVVVNPSELHSVLPGARASGYWFFILSPHILGGDSPDVYGDFWKKLAGRQLQFRHLLRQNAEMQALLADIVKEYSEARPGYELAIRSDLFRVLTELYRTQRAEEPDGRLRVRQQRQTERVKTALRIIQEQYGQPLTPGALAEACGVDQSYFCRMFRSAAGMSASAYLCAYRLEKAKVLLSGTDQPVTAVAEAVGFSDVCYFSRCFKKAYGVPPLWYRKFPEA